MQSADRLIASLRRHYYGSQFNKQSCQRSKGCYERGQRQGFTELPLTQGKSESQISGRHRSSRFISVFSGGADKRVLLPAVLELQGEAFESFESKNDNHSPHLWGRHFSVRHLQVCRMETLSGYQPIHVHDVTTFKAVQVRTTFQFLMSLAFFLLFSLGCQMSLGRETHKINPTDSQCPFISGHEA